jgi:hypothetical protein
VRAPPNVNVFGVGRLSSRGGAPSTVEVEPRDGHQWSSPFQQSLGPVVAPEQTATPSLEHGSRAPHTRYFENRSLRPFGVCCIVVGTACLIWFGIR